uniref:Mos1 transposase HTH domain-containing protein n=1 Tax=Glossina palpalis gambiensis TaxID=67801 RepID=A0A1B0BCJ2_9MUSC
MFLASPILSLGTPLSFSTPEYFTGFLPLLPDGSLERKIDFPGRTEISSRLSLYLGGLSKFLTILPFDSSRFTVLLAFLLKEGDNCKAEYGEDKSIGGKSTRSMENRLTGDIPGCPTSGRKTVSNERIRIWTGAIGDGPHPSVCDVNELFTERTISQSRSGVWFARFKSGDTRLENKPERDRPSDFDDQARVPRGRGRTLDNSNASRQLQRGPFKHRSSSQKA